MISVLQQLIDRLRLQPAWKIFLPLLALYTLFIVLNAEPDFKKDEWRYVYYAENLLQGEYSPAGTVFLWSGPGYPIIIAPFIAAGISFLWIKLLNALFFYFSVVLVYKSLRFYQSKKISFIGAAFWGIYWPAFEMLPYLMTESFTIFLISLIAFDTITLFSRKKTTNKIIVRLGFTLAFLALTKFIFGYVFVVGLLVFGVLYLLKRKSEYKTASLIYLLALLFCLPYLVYTFQLTGRTFYWGNAGGMQLYWMSSPYQEEKGDWINFTFNPSQFDDVNDLFRSRHENVYRQIMGDIPFLEGISTEQLILISNLQQDDSFKQLAIENIKANPIKYLKNWTSNVSRMLFNVPFSYQTQSAGFIKYLLFNGPILILLLLAIVSIFLRRKPIKFEIYFLLLFAMIYLSGSSLISAYPRQFYVVIPVLLIGMTSIFKGRININFAPDKSLVSTNKSQ